MANTASYLSKRRSFLKTAGSGAVLSCMLLDMAGVQARSVSSPDSLHKGKGRLLECQSPPLNTSVTHGMPEGYRLKTLLVWGQPLTDKAPPFDISNQTPEKQQQQFGYNCDFVGFFPLPDQENGQKQAILCVNHEYVVSRMMFAGPEGEKGQYSRTQHAVMQAAQGCSIVKLIGQLQPDGYIDWRLDHTCPLNRRISLWQTPIAFTGPAAGHKRLQTADDPQGREVIGTMQNCAGGMTPWGTYLTCEENIDYAFGGKLPDNHSETDNHASMGIGRKNPGWQQNFPRFDIAVTPNEPNRFGWVVEIDPLDPDAKPEKHTALGRFKHEGCRITIADNGQAVAYMGDDEYFQYVYKFISRDRYREGDKDHNKTLLQNGTLYVAKFHDDGQLEWLPLIFGQGALTAENGFISQADVVIEVRKAAKLMGATAMDRPEGIDIHPETGQVYISLTMNEKRQNVDKSNPRTANEHGHIIEVDCQPLAIKGQWRMLLLAGTTKDGGTWHSDTSVSGQFCCPDNIVFDTHKNLLWVATDQGKKWYHKSGHADGLWAVETQGLQRGLSQLFFRAPIGAEVAGPVFSPDNRTLFLSIQHPGIDGGKDWPSFGRDASYADPLTRWPDFDPLMPPRPGVVVITHRKGKIIGSA